LCEGQALLDFVENALFRKTQQRNITLKQLEHLTGKQVFMTALCLEDNRCHYITAQTHPNLSVATAVRMSMSVPFFFTPVKLDGKHFVDGGVTHNYPIQLWDDPEVEFSAPGGVRPQAYNPRTIGLKLMGPDEVRDRWVFPSVQQITSLFEFAQALVNNLSYQIERADIGDGYWERTLCVPSDIDMLDFGVSQTNIKRNMHKAYQKAQELLLFYDQQGSFV
jgi:predicted acylesterase/phospholipase RssA